MDIRKILIELAEPDYRDFQSRLLPDTHNLIGVRLPALRKIAKKIAKEDWKTFLLENKEDYFEEVMLKGMVIGYLSPAKTNIQEILGAIDDFLPKIDNWSVCDSFCSGLKIAKTSPDILWDYLLPLFKKQEPFILRFGFVMLLNYYIDDHHFHKILSLADTIHHNHYYVKMSIAWMLSACYIKYPEKTMIYLKNNQLDSFTYHKALQKIIESRQISCSTKAKIRNMKQKL